MNVQKIAKLADALAAIESSSTTAWIYLPEDKNWDLSSDCAILESEEVPPDMEDNPDAGIPEFAKKNGLVQTLPVTTLQDIIANARIQKSDPQIDDFFRAFLYYYKNDAFIDLTGH